MLGWPVFNKVWIKLSETSANIPDEEFHFPLPPEIHGRSKLVEVYPFYEISKNNSVPLPSKAKNKKTNCCFRIVRSCNKRSSKNSKPIRIEGVFSANQVKEGWSNLCKQPPWSASHLYGNLLLFRILLGWFFVQVSKVPGFLWYWHVFPIVSSDKKT